jgi:hypothetical protein
MADAVIDLAVFLATSDNDIVNEDAALQQLEQLARHLSQISPDDQKALVRRIQELADKTADKKRKQILDELPENLGLTG